MLNKRRSQVTAASRNLRAPRIKRRGNNISFTVCSSVVLAGENTQCSGSQESQHV